MMIPSSFGAVSLQAVNLLTTSISQGVVLAVLAAAGLRLASTLEPATRARLLGAVLLMSLLLFFMPFMASHNVRPGGAAFSLGTGWAMAVAAVWGTLSVWRAVQLGRSLLHLHGLARRATPLMPDQALAPLLRARRSAELCTSDEIDRPSLCGLVRPRILLPPQLLRSLSQEELAQVVLHEMEHLRRLDDWWNLLQQAMLALLPLHPGLLWLHYRLCQEREMACDDGVLRATHARKSYAACLVKLAEDSMLRRQIDFALSFLGSRTRSSDLVVRVRRVLAGTAEGTRPWADRPWGARCRMTTAFAAVLLTGTGIAVQHAPWVQFVTPQAAAAPRMALANLAPLAPIVPSVRVETVPAERGMSQAHPVLTSAVVSAAYAPAALKVRTVFRPHRRAAMRSTAGGAATPSAPATLRSVAVPEPVQARRVVLTGYEEMQPLYAAVPWQGGWLIVQL